MGVFVNWVDSFYSTTHLPQVCFIPPPGRTRLKLGLWEILT